MENEFKNKCDLIVEELKKFSTEIAHLGHSISDNRIESFEQTIKFILPDDFKYVLKKANGFSIMGTQIYGLDKTLRGSSLDSVYHIEHFEVAHKMPLQILPFSPDGRGNHYCLDLSKNLNGQCPVLFWQWGFEYPTIDDIEICNDNFINWIKEIVIDGTLEDYDYEGNERS